MAIYEPATGNVCRIRVTGTINYRLVECLFGNLGFILGSRTGSIQDLTILGGGSWEEEEMYGWGGVV